MGLLPCPPTYDSEKDSQSNSSHRLHSESSTSSLSSQPSLPSVPSLTPPSQQQKQVLYATPNCIATLKGHSSYISSLALTGKFLYSGSSNGEIRVWSRNPSSLLYSSTDNVVATSSGGVKSLVVLGDKLFSAHQDHKIRVWKIENTILNPKLKCIATLPTISDYLLRCFCAKNYVEVRRHKKSTWVHHVDAISTLAISRDGSLLYSASWDRTFKIWRTYDFRCLESVEKAHDDAINAIIVSHDGFVYTGSADKKIKVWKKQSGEKKHSLVTTMEKHKSAVNALAPSNDGSVLYSGACDRSILVWEKHWSTTGSENGEHMVLTGALRGHGKAILCLAVLSNLVFSGSADRTVRIWKKGLDKNYSCLAVLEGHKQPVKCLIAAVDIKNERSVSDSGASCLVYSGSLDCEIKIWQVQVPCL
ncbi:vegetative incompatibility protein HET-E-1 [Tripterygium wilfordii]|uniref:Vegetative incompatibility protein HET-E-1 n=1 Tax=Tripterygium wilfordii TaxID=458696 RepID=A0A7J7D3W5_TRIWF|nr:protein JINGUBANG-like [Tripterygium wilfordii]KAF5741037.1 vegetative incompatibility protein HET-E-1 [Tripterygium wilfordii]